MHQFVRYCKLNLFTMKTIVIALSLATLLCGCGKPDPRISKIEARLDSIETEQAAIREAISQNHIDATNALDLSESNVHQVTQLIDYIYKIVAAETNLDMRVSNLESVRSKTPAQFPSRPAVQPSSVSGQMPANVAAQIQSDAKKEWPGDYRMQVYYIKTQTEAWQKLHQ